LTDGCFGALVFTTPCSLPTDPLFFFRVESLAHLHFESLDLRLSFCADVPESNSAFCEMKFTGLEYRQSPCQVKLIDRNVELESVSLLLHPGNVSDGSLSNLIYVTASSLSPSSPFLFAFVNPGIFLSTGDIESFSAEVNDYGYSEHEDSYYPNTNVLYLERTGNEWNVEMIDRDFDVDSLPVFKNPSFLTDACFDPLAFVTQSSFPTDSEFLFSSLHLPFESFPP
jgi:hypothetical protein